LACTNATPAKFASKRGFFGEVRFNGAMQMLADLHCNDNENVLQPPVLAGSLPEGCYVLRLFFVWFIKRIPAKTAEHCLSPNMAGLGMTG